ncbi:MAG: hypothetical protein CM15mP30_5100 [Pelagibacteraceae bacterium]|nr:MAG: hypothetical protein CM15mP30_5100 [Pelagibacteraceae bacterium]
MVFKKPNSNKNNKKNLYNLWVIVFGKIFGAPTLMISIFNRERSKRDGEYFKKNRNLIKKVGTLNKKGKKRL